MSIYKIMGYGLTGLQLDDRDNIIDPRINTSSILLDWDREEEATVRNYVRSIVKSEDDLEPVLKGMYWSHMDPESTDPFDSVETFGETDLEGSIMLRPVGNTDWTRSGSLLDGLTEASYGNYGEDRIVNLRSGIYPYHVHFMDTETFERVKWDTIADWIRAVNDNSTDWIEYHASEALEKLGWGTIGSEGLKQRIAPMPPEEIIKLATFGNLFTDPKTVFELRPMLATYWR